MSERQVTRAIRRAVWERDGGICGLCSLPVPFDRTMHADHILLKSMGGSDALENLRTTHRACNLRRNDEGARRGRPRPQWGATISEARSERIVDSIDDLTVDEVTRLGRAMARILFVAWRATHETQALAGHDAQQ